ncbi:hypothetical protein H310_06788 [Aphanomyces invadans]|uniref:Uncharacterized protein n=1 Tax=Aphanomyces invadans TaxID=157072 RepID=A0A024U4M8_9STRA|nr:hypothetical protein H310_06788 [Aphanomyces invadans]ETW01195.1 hypothetical protein H310_06788 [Aphanomyces invadans]|eukprot:XP_008870193.1 hypothetical protein H310_06788 [Aphanomyces invadans]
MELELQLMQIRQDEQRWAAMSTLQRSRIHQVETALAQLHRVFHKLLSCLIQTQAIRRLGRQSSRTVCRGNAQSAIVSRGLRSALDHLHVVWDHPLAALVE